MSTPWRILDFTGYEGRISANRGFVHVGDKHIALVDISVMLMGTSVDIHASVFDRAAAFGIPIVHCDWKGVPVGATLSWSDNARVAARHIAQAELELPRRKNAWMRIVKAKIQGQSHNLRDRDDESANYLLQLSRSVRSGDPSNCEGQASRYYWRRIFGDPSFRRKASTRASANGMLDYGYTILRGTSIRAIVAAGLWPTLGIWHRNRSNCFALADDIIEPFRPAVDRVVMDLLLRADSSLDAEGKKALVGVLDHAFTRDGYSVTTEINKLTQNLARYAEGEEKLLAVPIFGGCVETG